MMGLNRLGDPFMGFRNSDDQLFKAHRMASPIVVPGAGHFLTLERLGAVLRGHFEVAR